MGQGNGYVEVQQASGKAGTRAPATFVERHLSAPLCVDFIHSQYGHEVDHRQLWLTRCQFGNPRGKRMYLPAPPARVPRLMGSLWACVTPGQGVQRRVQGTYVCGV